MFYAYVLQSEKDESFYKGHCEHLEERIKQHNLGMTASIKNRIPFKLVYSEIFETRPEAIKRERYFKSAAGRRFLKEKLANKAL
jgi:putative endonuclease